jgi:peptidyl-tRNA hydrolase
VLQPFDSAHLPLVTQTVDHAIQAVEMWLTHGIDIAMNHYNGTMDNQPDSSD